MAYTPAEYHLASRRKEGSPAQGDSMEEPSKQVTEDDLVHLRELPGIASENHTENGLARDWRSGCGGMGSC